MMRALLATLLLAAAPSYTVSGTVPKNAVAVWLAGAPIPPPATVEMHNVNRTFTPALAIVPVHGQVRFPNDDPFYHSIYSADKQNGFDIGYYDTGPGKLVTFDHPGVVQVRCHIHAYMHGMIVVADGPYATASNGAFSIAGVPQGKYTLHEVMENGSEKTQAVAVSGNTSVNL